jgi:hypothetical protein
MADYCTHKEVITTIKGGGAVIGELDQKTLINRLITAYSRMIDQYCKRGENAFIAPAASIKYFNGNNKQILLVDDMAAVPTEIAVAEAGDITDYTVWAATDYLVEPYDEAPYYELIIDSLNGTKSVWPNYRKAIRVTAKWGYSEAVPKTIKNACIIQVIRAFKRAQQAYADSGAVLELGKMTHAKQLDPEVKNMLDTGDFVVIGV